MVEFVAAGFHKKAEFFLGRTGFELAYAGFGNAHFVADF